MAIATAAPRDEPNAGGVPMRLRTLAGALALGLGAVALVPAAVQAQDRGRDHRSARRIEVVQGSRYDRSRGERSYDNSRSRRDGRSRGDGGSYRSLGDGRSYRDGRSYSRSYRDDRSYRLSYRSYSYARPYRSYSYARPYRYRSYSYAYPYYDGYAYDGYYDDGYYGDYCDDGYYSSYHYRRAPRLVAYPSFRYYRPALGVRLGGRHLGVWLGF